MHLDLCYVGICRDRYQRADASVSRCLKLSLTDGVQRVTALEYRPIRALQVDAPAGLKVAITDASVRGGMLLLLPENLDILGGQVDRLEEARQKVAECMNMDAAQARFATPPNQAILSRQCTPSSTEAPRCTTQLIHPIGTNS